MKKFHSPCELERHLSNMLERIRNVVVVFLEVICTETEQLESDANMTVVVEPITHRDAFIFHFGILFPDFTENVDFQKCSIAVLLNVFNDFQGYFRAISVV
jgi:hypothetical protein